MNREIKFQFWDKVFKVMYTWEDVLRAEKSIRDLFDNDEIIERQFTGLTDRNGVEIYEGDIVDYGADYSVVRYQDGCFWSRVGQYQLYNHNKNDIEVIGNIYEHPHLLEGVN